MRLSASTLRTLLGPIKDLDALLGTAYGVTWFVALVVAVLTFLWGHFAITGGPASSPPSTAVGTISRIGFWAPLQYYEVAVQPALTGPLLG